jgi:hypothetical protein
MPWVATDYHDRSIDEILARGSGNCDDHARVLQSILESRGIRTRWVQEINIQPPSPWRQANAERRISERGLSASVFGRQHNDHRWLEVWDDAQSQWFPADSALGIVGTDAWMRARLGFGDRPKPVEQMLVPFFVAASASSSELEDRSQFYLVDAFDAAYGNRLHTLAAWQAWKASVLTLEQAGLRAFRAEENLHDHDSQMTQLLAIYMPLREQAVAAGIDSSPAGHQ